MLDFLELEETVGRFWHRLVGDTASLPHHPQAAVTLASMAPTLAVCFRGFGGEPGVRIVPAREREAAHRLNLRQRVGLGEERLAQALRTPDALQLPARIALFPEPGLNRDLYVWLAACMAAMPLDAEGRCSLRSLQQAADEAESALNAMMGEKHGRR